MRRTAVAVLLFVVAFGSTRAVADCQNYQCQESETTATCYIFFCNGAGCNNSWLVESCTVTCDRMPGGGCYCTPQGWCYDI